MNVAQKYQKIWEDYKTDVHEINKSKSKMTITERKENLKARIEQLFEDIHNLEPEFSQYLLEQALEEQDHK